MHSAVYAREKEREEEREGEGECASEIHEAYRIYPVELNGGMGTSSAGSALWIDRCYRYATYSLSVCLSDWLTNARQRDRETQRQTQRQTEGQTIFRAIFNFQPES